MKMRPGIAAFIAAPAMALVLALGVACAVPAAAQQPRAPSPVEVDADDIGGRVVGPHGPEAGVWVVAETRELPTRFIRIVVTDDEGRFVVPDLPQAGYEIFVRGYGLVDSPRVRARPGQVLELAAVPAPDAAAAARIYPAIHWYAMLRIPEASRFGGGGDIPAGVTREEWLNLMKSNGCVGCHQMGQASTRAIPKAFLEEFPSHEDAWMRRVQSGQAGEQMVNILAGTLGGAPFAQFADWTRRIAAGELPATRPERPRGEERNIVVTLREWLNEKQYLHDLIASDRRDPTVNAWGPLYGAPEYSTDEMPVLDPVRNTVASIRLPVAPGTPEALGPGHAASAEPLQPSAYWGAEKIWDTRANNHNSMFDRRGRLWLAATGHPPANPDFCRRGSSHPATTRSGPAAAAPSSAGSTRASSTRRATSRAPRAGRRSSSTPTGMAAATRMSSPDSRPIRRATRASSLASTRSCRIPPMVRSGALCAGTRAPSCASSLARIPRARRSPRSTACPRPASACGAATSMAAAWSGSRWRAAISAPSIARSAAGS